MAKTVAKKKKRNTKHWSERDPRMLDACCEGQKFARRFKSPQAAWAAVTDPEWMEWYLCCPNGGSHPMMPGVQVIAESKLADDEKVRYIRALVPDPTKGWGRRS